MIQIPAKDQAAANSGFGYLFRFDELAAKLGERYGADWVLVGQHSKPSFLFSYLLENLSGSRYFCESFYGHPCPTSGKNHATAHACGCPSRSLRLRSEQALLYLLDTQQGEISNIILAMTRHDVGKPAFSLRKQRSVKTQALSLLGTTRLLSRRVCYPCHQQVAYFHLTNLTPFLMTFFPTDGPVYLT